MNIAGGFTIEKTKLDEDLFTFLNVTSFEELYNSLQKNASNENLKKIIIDELNLIPAKISEKISVESLDVESLYYFVSGYYTSNSPLTISEQFQKIENKYPLAKNIRIEEINHFKFVVFDLYRGEKFIRYSKTIEDYSPSSSLKGEISYREKLHWFRSFSRLKAKDEIIHFILYEEDVVPYYCRYISLFKNKKVMERCLYDFSTHKLNLFSALSIFNSDYSNYLSEEELPLLGKENTPLKNAKLFNSVLLKSGFSGFFSEEQIALSNLATQSLTLLGTYEIKPFFLSSFECGMKNLKFEDLLTTRFNGPRKRGYRLDLPKIVDYLKEYSSIKKKNEKECIRFSFLKFC